MTGRATLTTEPSTKARLEARIEAARVQVRCGQRRARWTAAVPPSHGAAIAVDIRAPLSRSASTLAERLEEARRLARAAEVDQATGESRQLGEDPLPAGPGEAGGVDEEFPVELLEAAFGHVGPGPAAILQRSAEDS